MQAEAAPIAVHHLETCPVRLGRRVAFARALVSRPCRPGVPARRARPRSRVGQNCIPTSLQRLQDCNPANNGKSPDMTKNLISLPLWSRRRSFVAGTAFRGLSAPIPLHPSARPNAEHVGGYFDRPRSRGVCGCWRRRKKPPSRSCSPKPFGSCSRNGDCPYCDRIAALVPSLGLPSRPRLAALHRSLDLQPPQPFPAVVSRRSHFASRLRPRLFRYVLLTVPFGVPRVPVSPVPLASTPLLAYARFVASAMKLSKREAQLLIVEAATSDPCRTLSIASSTMTGPSIRAVSKSRWRCAATTSRTRFSTVPGAASAKNWFLPTLALLVCCAAIFAPPPSPPLPSSRPRIIPLSATNFAALASLPWAFAFPSSSRVVRVLPSVDRSRVSLPRAFAALRKTLRRLFG